MFTKAKFILSAAKLEQFPDLKMGEIAIVGRSNVGKSSLINHLTQNRGLAKVSATPGKTQLINFFTVDEEFVLVDLPGYGFAKVPKGMREEWGTLIQNYLQSRKQLRLILLLCDSRHPPTEEDIAFAKWAIHFKQKLVVVFTKVDKLSQSMVQSSCEKNFALLSEAIGDKPIAYFPYSIKNAKGRLCLIKELEKRM
ncbi:MAG: YihA family ribosome biogenesis GTP-binding protein [Verrucomicrobia bacterium]|nr:YihA family ribosome biogenesis GTP-binding protein [Verrucomicrobiota bacterium]